MKKTSETWVNLFSYPFRNRKHVLCLYRVLETQVKVLENKKCCGSTSRRWVFPQLYQVLPNFHECFYNSREIQRTCFLFLWENTATEKRKSTCLLWSSTMTCKFYLLAPSLCGQLVLVLCFYQVTDLNTVLNKSMCIFALGYFVNTIKALILSHVV